jgi:hypothetical protein
MTFEELRDSLVAGGVPVDLASQVAAAQLAKIQAELAAVQEAARKAAEDAAGIQDWCGLRVTKLGSNGRPTGYTVAMDNGIAAEPAKLGTDQDGNGTFFPGYLWVARKKETLQNIPQSVCNTLHNMLQTPEGIEVLKQATVFASNEGLAAYAAKRRELIDAGTIADWNRGKKKTAKKA